jgi:methionyl-tRNA formyltransferase
MMPLRLAFMGTPAFAVPALTEIVASGHDVAAVYTQPPRPAGRGQAERRTPVHELAASLGLPVRTPSSLKSTEDQEAFAALGLDAGVVVAYGLILPQAVLDAPRLGCVNLHASLLPRWRGAAPIQRAVMAGDALTGVQVMQIAPGLDEGPILLSETLRIKHNDTAGSLHDRLAEAGAQLLVRALAALEAGRLEATPQATEGVSYAKKIDKAEARIDWARPAAEIDRQIRGLSPFPGAWFELAGEKGPVRVKALACALAPEADMKGAAPGTVLDDALLVATGQGALRLKRLQREGRKVQDAGEFLRGTSVARGASLS